MRNDHSAKRRDKARAVRAVLTGMTVGSILCVLLLLVSVYVIVKLPSVPYGGIGWLTMVTEGVSCLVGGYISGRIGRRRRLVLGMISGGGIFLIMLSIGLCFGGTVGLVTLLRLAAAVMGGGLGGLLAQPLRTSVRRAR